MTEFFSPEEIENVPTQEIARWAARIKRVNYALSENKSIYVGSDIATDDDSAVVDQFANQVAAANRAGFSTDDWQGDPAYEDSILYELKPTVELRSVVQLKLMQSSEHGVEDETLKRYWAAGRLVLHDGLERIGVITDDETQTDQFTVPAAAMANFCLQRGFLNHPIDRSVSARKSEIVAAQAAIEAAAKPRGIRHRGGLASIYHELSYPNQALQNHLGGGSHRELWWRELEQDLGRIDQASFDQG